MVSFICPDFIEPLPDVFGAVLGNYETVVAQRSHIITQFRADLKSDNFPLRVQVFEDMFGDDSVARSEFNDGSCGRKVDAVNCRLAECRAATGEGTGGTKVA